MQCLGSIIAVAVLALANLANAQTPASPPATAPADGGATLVLYLPQTPPSAYQPYSLVLELTNTAGEPIAIRQALPPLAAFYRDQHRETTAGQETPRLAVYFERPPGTSRDVDRHQPLPKHFVTIEPGKSHLSRIEIPQGILAPGDNRFTAVLHESGKDIAESPPLTLHCDPPPTR